MTQRTVDPTRQNVRTVSRLEREALRSRSSAEPVSDALTRAIASIPSITFHATWFVAWILVNTSSVPGIAPFDPFPVGVLTLIVSTEGVLLAVIILVSQNRMIRQADRRAHLDLQVSVLTEPETTLVLHSTPQNSRSYRRSRRSRRRASEQACRTDRPYRNDARFGERAAQGVTAHEVLLKGS